MRILLADDHGIVRKGMCQLVQDAFPDVAIGEVADGAALVEEACRDEWDLVISDISMPKLNGLDALRELQQCKPALPVLIVSMHSEGQYATRVFRAGASGYLTKDTVHEELITAIQTLLRGEKYIPPAMAQVLADALKREDRTKGHEQLSDREFMVMKLLAQGKSTSAIAAEHKLSVTTVSTYRSRILEKMGFSSNAEITRYAIEHKLI